MSRLPWLTFAARFSLTLLVLTASPRAFAQVRRVVILKVDGLNADLLYRNMRETDPATGKSRLPWFSYIFGSQGHDFRKLLYARHQSFRAVLVNAGYGAPRCHSRKCRVRPIYRARV